MRKVSSSSSCQLDVLSSLQCNHEPWLLMAVHGKDRYGPVAVSRDSMTNPTLHPSLISLFAPLPFPIESRFPR